MRPCVTSPLLVRGREVGGAKPLFCVPVVASDGEHLVAQAQVARGLGADLVEWRADSYGDLSLASLLEGMRRLRAVLVSEPILFTLRIQSEGGQAQISQDDRAVAIEAVVRSGMADLIDVELCNGAQFLGPVMKAAREHGVQVMLSFHDFAATPANEVLLGKIAAMIEQGADIAKIACMPREPGDVLRLLQVTLSARQAYPALPLCTMSMGAMGRLSRVAGFVYGCDVAFAVGEAVSAPGQIPIGEARAIAESLLREG